MRQATRKTVRHYSVVRVLCIAPRCSFRDHITTYANVYENIINCRPSILNVEQFNYLSRIQKRH